MNNQLFKGLILKSNHIDYPENKSIKIYIKKFLDEGSYGLIFLIQNNHVIKLFKNSTQTNAILNESNYLIPTKNENRELIFFLNYINKLLNNNKYITEIYAVGIIKDIIMFNSIKLSVNNYFIILPLYIPFYNIFTIYNIPLIDKHNGLSFTLKIMERLLEIAFFLETKYNLINVDSKLSNYMFICNDNNLNNLIMIDFSIIKKINLKKYNVTNKYYILPYGNNLLIQHFPSYSVCINALELLFGYNKIRELPDSDKINYYLSIIKKKK